MIKQIIFGVVGLFSSLSICQAQDAEEFQFQAKADRLRRMLTNSMYKNPESFLRELLSNSSDALEKFRILSLTNKGDGNPLAIRIKFDKPSRTLTIEDNGIGMSKDDLINYLGTIAESGTSKMLEKQESSNMIGQFGIGFYSAFIVANKIEVFSKQQNEKIGHVWESSEETSSFKVRSAPEFDLFGTKTGESDAHGTKTVLHMKTDEFLDESSLKTIAKKYAEFFSFPIYFEKSKR